MRSFESTILKKASNVSHPLSRLRFSCNLMMCATRSTGCDRHLQLESTRKGFSNGPVMTRSSSNERLRVMPGMFRTYSDLDYIAKTPSKIMDEVKEYTFEELRRIVEPIAKSYGMKQVYLFGSRARGDNREDSDYDFCVVTSDDCDLFELGGFFAELRDALGVEIDLVCQESLRDDFNREVLRDRKLLYEA